MAKEKKLYQLQIGLLDDDGSDTLNWSSKTVIARDAGEAIRKARPASKEYVVAATIISTVDVM